MGGVTLKEVAEEAVEIEGEVFLVVDVIVLGVEGEAGCVGGWGGGWVGG